MTYLRNAFLLITLLAGVVAYAKDPCPTTGPTVPELSEIAATLFLIGDAGVPDKNGEPALRALGDSVQQANDRIGPRRVLTVFLGDNIYPAGLPEKSSGAYPDAIAALTAQLSVFRELSKTGKGAPPVGVFVPGNHDWGEEKSDGLDRIMRQATWLKVQTAGQVKLLPEKGCPGPVIIDVGPALRVIALDTHWWLRYGPKPEGAAGGCPNGSQESVIRALKQSLAESGARRAVVVAHHPLISGGPHGGETNWLRGLGLIPQDVPSKRYQHLKKSLRRAFADRQPLLYAAGHDHSLQLLKEDGFPFHVVSGSGSMKNLTDVYAIDGTIFCREASGFFRLDVNKTGKARLAMIAVEKSSGQAKEVFSAYLD